jgi:hypothetical protein
MDNVNVLSVDKYFGSDLKAYDNKKTWIFLFNTGNYTKF